MDINDREKYIGPLIDNGDFRNREDFEFLLFYEKEDEVNWLRWRALGGTFVDEVTKEGFTEACQKLLKEVSPEGFKSFEKDMEQYEQFRMDLINNGFTPTKNLMDTYITLLEAHEKGIFSEILEQIRRGSSNKLINDIGDALQAHEHSKENIER